MDQKALDRLFVRQVSVCWVRGRRGVDCAAPVVVPVHLASDEATSPPIDFSTLGEMPDREPLINSKL